MVMIDDASILDHVDKALTDRSVKNAVKVILDYYDIDREAQTIIMLPPRVVPQATDILKIGLMEELRERMARVFEDFGAEVILARAPYDGKTYNAQYFREGCYPWMKVADHQPVIVKAKTFNNVKNGNGNASDVQQPVRIYQTNFPVPRVLKVADPNIAGECVIRTHTHLITFAEHREDFKLLNKIAANLGYDEKLKVFADLASALATLHMQGFVHNDLKPDVILMLLQMMEYKRESRPYPLQIMAWLKSIMARERSEKITLKTDTIRPNAET